MFEQAFMPQFKLIHKRFDQHDARFDQHDARFDKIEKELLDIQEFAIPRINELQENVKFIVKEVNELAKGGNQKRTAQELRGLEALISRLKKELDKVNYRIAKFEQKLKEIRESRKYKTAK